MSRPNRASVASPLYECTHTQKRVKAKRRPGSCTVLHCILLYGTVLYYTNVVQYCLITVPTPTATSQHAHTHIGFTESRPSVASASSSSRSFRRSAESSTGNMANRRKQRGAAKAASHPARARPPCNSLPLAAVFILGGGKPLEAASRSATTCITSTQVPSSCFCNSKQSCAGSIVTSQQSTGWDTHKHRHTVCEPA